MALAGLKLPIVAVVKVTVVVQFVLNVLYKTDYNAKMEH